MLSHLHSKDVPPHVQVELSVIQVLPIASCPIAGNTTQSLVHPLDTLPSETYKHS